MEKSAVGPNKTNNNNKQRRQRIEINGGGGGFAGILLLGGVAFTAAAFVAATTFAKNNSNKRRKSIHDYKKKEEEEEEQENESTDTTTTISSNKIKKFEQGRNELGLLSLLHHDPSSSPEESSSELCSKSTSNVIEFGATMRIGSTTKIVISPCDDESDVAIKSFLACGGEEQGALFNDNSLSNRVPFANSFGGRSLGINMGLVVDQENINKKEEDNDINDDEFEEDNDNDDDDEFDNDEHESIEEKGEEDSEGTGDSSRASNAEAIWPQELIEGEDNPLELKEMKTHNLVTQANKAFEELVREDAMKNDNLGFHQQNEREPGLTMVHHLTVSKSRFWLWSTLAMGLLLLVIHSLLHNILSSTL